MPVLFSEPSDRASVFALLVGAGVALLPAALLSTTPAHAQGVGQTPEATSVAVPTKSDASASSTVGTPPAAAAELAVHVERLRTHVTTLANPFFEGRFPGTRGQRLAADYLEWNFRTIGLQPAFDAASAQVPAAGPVEEARPPRGENAGDAAGATTAPTPATSAPRVIVGELIDTSAHSGMPRVERGRTFRQTFLAPPTNVVAEQKASYRAGERTVSLEPGRDFNVLGLSGAGEVEAPLAFAGYAIASGNDGYASFPDESRSLEGKIAIILRFEPMNEAGSSRWAAQGWSFLAALEPKISAAVRRGARAVILVNPPGANDERVGRLEDVSSVTARQDAGVPVVMLSIDAADALVRAADPQGRSLLDLRRLADEKGELIDLPNATVALSTRVDRLRAPTDNVGAVLPGVGDLKDRYIVIGAHYDHLGFGQVGVRFPTDRGQLHPGADDNASGTSGMLLIARRLAEAYAALPPDQPRRSVLFIGFCAEESGLNGSRYYTRNPIAPADRHDLMINLDMIGYLGGELKDGERPGRPLEVGGVGTAQGLAEWLDPYFTSSGLKITPRQGGSGPSDHASFYAANIPVLFFFTGLHPNYHRPADVASLINFEGAAQVADLAFRVAFDAATRTEPFVFTSTNAAGAAQAPGAGPGMRGTRVRFGIAPGDYSGDEKGVLVGEVLPETPAARAGIRKDDLITRWNDTPVTSVEDWMPLLAAASPGDVVKVTVLRDKQPMVIDVKLEARATGPR